jgi:general secretion pathway protein I
MKGRQTRPPRGLSLIEVLVALFILALLLATASQAISGWLRVAQRQSDTLRAQLCADNALHELRLLRSMPGTGSSTVMCEQAGQVLQVQLDISPTPNPVFLRVDASVSVRQQPVLRVSSILGRY